MQKIPYIAPELIEYLEEICPDKAPSLKTEERSIWFEAGKVDLVRHLRRVSEEQNQTILQGD